MHDVFFDEPFAERRIPRTGFRAWNPPNALQYNTTEFRAELWNSKSSRDKKGGPVATPQELVQIPMQPLELSGRDGEIRR